MESKELSKAKRNQRHISDDLRTKDTEICDHRNKIGELQIKLNDFAAAYEVNSSSLLHGINACNDSTYSYN